MITGSKPLSPTTVNVFAVAVVRNSFSLMLALDPVVTSTSHPVTTPPPAGTLYVVGGLALVCTKVSPLEQTVNAPLSASPILVAPSAGEAASRMASPVRAAASRLP